MTNELRKTLGRNMHYSQMNKQIDGQIQQLQAQVLYNPQARAQINALQQQKAANEQQMRQPLSAQEYADYDEYGQYVGRNDIQQLSQPQVQWQKPVAGANSFSQAVADGINHAAQGLTLGWSDEIHGIMGGAKKMYENWQSDYSSKESYLDAFKQGYKDYRDISRQELQDGYQRNPKVAIGAEIAGAMRAPSLVKGITGAVVNGVIGGIGMTDANNPSEYALNIGINTAGSVAGEKFGHMLGDKSSQFLTERAKNLSFGLSNTYRPVSFVTKFGTTGITNQINNWRKQDE